MMAVRGPIREPWQSGGDARLEGPQPPGARPSDRLHRSMNGANIRISCDRGGSQNNAGAPQASIRVTTDHRKSNREHLAIRTDTERSLSEPCRLGAQSIPFPGLESPPFAPALNESGAIFAALQPPRY